MSFSTGIAGQRLRTASFAGPLVSNRVMLFLCSMDRPRLIAALGIIAAFTLAVITVLQSPSAEPGPPRTASEASEALPDNRDTELYRAVIHRLQQGDDYYNSVAELHRERSYPLYPFFTVRPPTLAWASAAIGSSTLFLVAWFLLLANIIVWMSALRDSALAERALFVGLVALVGASTITPAGIVLHEFWCGMLLTLALGLYRQEQWRTRLLCIALALALREFAVAFLAVIGFSALLRKHWAEVAASAAIGAAFLLAMWLHYLQVVDVRLPSDLQSPPWNGLRGHTAVVQDMARISFLGLVPMWLAAGAVFVALLGWAWAPMRLEALLWLIGFGGVIAFLSRPNNEYWILILLPAWLAGLAYAWRAVAQLIGSGRNAEE